MDRKYYDQIAALAAKLPKEYQGCRLRGHDYQAVAATQRGRLWDVKKRCRNCPTERDYVLDQFGVIVEARQGYQPNDYHLKGHGYDATSAARGFLRLQELASLIQRGQKGMQA